MIQRHDLALDTRLLSVDSRRVPLYQFDVLVLGSGCAGGSAALAAADDGAQVAVLSKSRLEEANTLYAQGGVAAAEDPLDSFAEHARDTLRLGLGLADEAVVRAVVANGPAAIERLVLLGARFDRRSDGSFELAREGGHTHPRVLHAGGDATGREIQATLVRALTNHERITCFPDTFVIDLLCGAGGRVSGVLVEMPDGRVAAFSGGSVVLATGGAGQLYRETTNPPVATGDGVAIALRAGAVLRDLEFYQFHPTLLYIAGAARVLISEVVRGHGGILRDKHGVRFLAEGDAELSPRDVVSRAAFHRMVETNDTSVYLDLSQVSGDPHALFPGISRICRFFGIDIARDPVPVRPGAHYQIGGVEVDLDGRTSVDGLWAVGEVASTGLHGANRMGSNSLLEGLVLGERAGHVAASEASGRGLGRFEARLSQPNEPAPGGVRLNVQDVTYSLKSLMWRQLGVVREREAMDDALAKVRLWTHAVRAMGQPQSSTWELANLLTIAQLAVLGAREREESRGVHHRSDFPAADPAWVAHTRYVPQFDGAHLVGVTLERDPVVVPEPAR